MDAFKSQYGGKVQGPYSRGGNNKPFWFWAVDAQKAENFLAHALPFLIVKRERALVALQFRKLFKGDSILPRGLNVNPEKTQQILNARSVFYDQMRALNQRGLAK